MKGKKKGETSALNYLGALIIIGVLLFVLITQIQRQGESTTKVMTHYTESLTNDYDGDRINDFYDKSPCVAGEDVIISREDGKQYFFFADALGADAQKTCKGISNKYEEVLAPHVEESTGLTVCILPETTCAKELEIFYKSLRS
jgi:predicted PurR-regulated permease PerM